MDEDYMKVPLMAKNSSDSSRHSTDHDTDSGSVPIFTTKRIMKNIMVLSLVFLLRDLGVLSLYTLQSSLFIDEGLGVITQSIMHGTRMVSCFILPTVLIGKLGHKWTISLSFIGDIVWMAANAYAVWGTMIPASIIGGLCAGPSRIAVSSYFLKMAFEKAKLENEKPGDVTALFFGIFFAVSQSSVLIGSAISATVLQSGKANYSKPGEDETAFCGMNDCPGRNQTNVNFNKPADDVVWTLLAVYIAACVSALIISIFFVDNLPSHLTKNGGPNNNRENDIKSGSETKAKNTSKGIIELLGATAKQLCQVNQCLLVTIIIFTGSQQAFIQGEYTKSWVTCYMGIWWIGVVVIPTVVLNIISSFLVGRLTKYTGRLAIITAGFFLELAGELTLIFWKPHSSDEFPMFFFVPALWGFTTAIFMTQINILSGILFSTESEAAYSNFQVFQALGLTAAYAYSAYLCAAVKLYILLSVFLFGMAGYFTVEIMQRRNKYSKIYGKSVKNQS